MTLNVASYSAFPASIHLDADFGSTRRDMNAQGFPLPYWLNLEIDDPIHLLPEDPFGMDLSTTFSAAASGWIEDFGANPSDFEVGYYCNRALLCLPEAQLSSRNASQDGVLGSTVGMEEIPNSSGAEEAQNGGEEDGLHEAFHFSLLYLGVRDLLSVERVCRSLCSTIRNDPLLWRCIHIEPLLREITDDALLRLTQRAHGHLQCLSLVRCLMITDDGLKRVLESSPRLRKLNVSGCLRLTTGGLINNLKAFKSSAMTGIKNLRLGKFFFISSKQVEEFTLLLGVDKLQQLKACKLRFYHSGEYSPSCDDDRAIDLELCPRCQKFRLIYDCTLKSCQEKGPEHCRACEICIERCVECGRCIDDYCVYTETFCLDYVCFDCLPNYKYA